MNSLISLFAVVFVALISIQNGDCYAARRTSLEDEEPSNDLLDNFEKSDTKDNRRNNYVEIEKFPKHAIRLQPGTRTEIRCIAKGSPAPTIIWLKNNLPIEEEQILNELLPVSDRSFASTSSILVINSISATPQDIYTCLATADHNSDAKSVIVYSGVDDSATDIEGINNEMARQPAKPLIINYFSLFLDSIGSSVLFPCRAVGNPPPKIEWRNERGHQVITSNSRIRILENGDLFIRNLLWKDMGGFTCVATNEFGQDKQEVFVYPFLPSEKDTTK